MHVEGLPGLLGIVGGESLGLVRVLPHNNLREETAVKSMKRLVTANTGPGGTLNTDSFASALMTYRNTPDRDTGLSPSPVLFARRIRDAVPCNKDGLLLRPEWVLIREAREKALARRHQVRGGGTDRTHQGLVGLGARDGG